MNRKQKIFSLLAIIIIIILLLSTLVLWLTLTEKIEITDNEQTPTTLSPTSSSSSKLSSAISSTSTVLTSSVSSTSTSTTKSTLTTFTTSTTTFTTSSTTTTTFTTLSTTTTKFTTSTTTTTEKSNEVLFLNEKQIFELPSFTTYTCSNLELPSTISSKSFGRAGTAIDQQGIERLLIGGFKESSGSDSGIWYIRSENGWEEAGKSSHYREFSASSHLEVSKESWIVTGGKTTSGNSSQIFSKGSWTDGPNLPESVQNHCQINLNGDVYIIGGRSTDTHSSVYKLENDDWVSKQDLQSARMDHTCVVHNGLIYTIGGATDVNNPDSSVEIYDEASDTWSTGTNFPSPLKYLQAISFDGTLYVFGGVGSNNIANDKVFALTENDAWQALVGVKFTDGQNGFPTFSPSIKINPELLHCQ